MYDVIVSRRNRFIYGETDNYLCQMFIFTADYHEARTKDALLTGLSTRQCYIADSARHTLHGLVWSRRPSSSTIRCSQYDAAGPSAYTRRRNDVTR